MICIENAGLYDDALLYFLEGHGYWLCLENAYPIRKSIRDRRAKNDRLDARHIAMYALRHHDELERWQKPREVIGKLKQLLSSRRNLVEALKRIKQVQKELIILSGQRSIKLTAAMLESKDWKKTSKILIKPSGN